MRCATPQYRRSLRGPSGTETSIPLSSSGRRREPLTLGVVFPFSSDHLHLREWLRAAGIDPDDTRLMERTTIHGDYALGRALDGSADLPRFDA